MKPFMTTLVVLLAILTTAALAAPPFPVPGSPTVSPFRQDAGSRDLTGFTFDTDNEGWQETYVGWTSGAYEVMFDNTPAGHTMTLGDPAGCIFETVTDDVNQRAYWMGYYATNAFFGDISGQILQSNVYSTANWRTVSGDHGGAGGDDGNVYGRWVVSWTNPANPAEIAMYISKRSASVDLNSFTGWTAATISITESNFLRWPNSSWSTPSFAEVMANYDQIGMYIFSGTDDLNDVNGGGTTWFNDDGIHRIQHFGAYAIEGDATWALDNVQVDYDVVRTEAISYGSLKALFR